MTRTTTKTAWSSSGSRARASVVTVDSTRSSVEGNSAVAWSYEVSGGLAWSDCGAKKSMSIAHESSGHCETYRG